MQAEHSLKRTALIASAMSAFLPPFMISSTNIVLPSIGKDFNMNAGQIGGVVPSYILSSAVFLVPFGRLSDILGRRRIFIYGLSVFTLFTLLIGLTPAAALAHHTAFSPGFRQRHDLQHRDDYNCFRVPS
jgi:MFS family permease